MRHIFVIAFSFLLSCNGEKHEEDVKYERVDSIIMAAKAHRDSSVVVLQLADKKALDVVGNAAERFDSIHKAHAGLKNEYNDYKIKSIMSLKVVQRDTIYVTEKKNFWGKTRRTIDSTSSSHEDTLSNQ